MAFIPGGTKEVNELLKALKLDHLEVMELHLHIVPDDVIRIDVMTIMTNDQVEDSKEVVEKWDKFQLVKVEEEQDIIN